MITICTWNGFKAETFSFEQHESIIVFPNTPNKNKSFALKTEYWDAFPEAAEIDLLNKGFHLCFIKNNNRWGTNDDLNRKARFVKYISNKYNLSSKCVPIGMSCGGLFAVKFAAKFPKLVSCMYLDAPVVNYLSCPCGFGVGESLSENNDEILNALGLSSISQLLSYREMPLDYLPKLIKSKIPVVLVAGDSDTVVPFCENGELIKNEYEINKLPIKVYIKSDCNHHPHGLENNKPVIDFILKYSNC